MRFANLLLPIVLFPLAVTAAPVCLDHSMAYQAVRDSVVTLQGVENGSVLGTGFLFRTADDDSLPPGGPWIVTNAHVVGDRDRVKVIRPGRGAGLATVAGIEVATDLAYLEPGFEIAAEGLAFSQKTPSVGEVVWSIGTPFGMKASLVSGHVSGIGRFFSNEPEIPYLQLDMALNPGGSGGPLLDAEGRVVGVTTQVVGRSDNRAGMAFAIPSWLVRRSLREALLDQVEPHWLGLALTDDADRLGVQAVAPGSPAEKAGLQAGDVLRGLNPREHLDGRLRSRLIGPRQGDVNELIVERPGGEQPLQLAPEPAAASERRIPWLGVSLRPHPRGGLEVLEVSDAGHVLRPGDRLLRQRNRPVRSPGELERPRGRDSTPLLLEREGSVFFTPVGIVE